MKRELYCWLVIGALMWAWALNSRAVTFAWDAPTDTTGIAGYRLYWSTGGLPPVDFEDVGLALQATLADEIFPFGVTYTFVARSYAVAGNESVDSNAITWTRAMPTPTPTPIPTPSPPQNLRFQLTVINGRGGGSYEPGTLVLVIANRAPKRYAFSRWGGDWVILANPYLARTTATIPYRDVSVEALYEPKPK
jgi:hypothetical protein